jgi:hypothetical protein
MPDDSHASVVNTIAEKAATAATYGGSASAVFFGLNAAEFAALAGAAIAFAGFLVNVWFKHQHLKLAREQALARKLDSDTE